MEESLRLPTLLKHKRSINNVLNKHREYLDAVRKDPVPIKVDFILEFARNMTHSLSAPDSYHEGVPLTRYFHPPAPQPIEMRQGRIYELQGTSAKEDAHVSAVPPQIVTLVQASIQTANKEAAVNTEPVAKKARIDLNFGLEDDSD